jgi:hypothetical protein
MGSYDPIIIPIIIIIIGNFKLKSSWNVQNIHSLLQDGHTQPQCPVPPVKYLLVENSAYELVRFIGYTPT